MSALHHPRSFGRARPGRVALLLGLIALMGCQTPEDPAPGSTPGSLEAPVERAVAQPSAPSTTAPPSGPAAEPPVEAAKAPMKRGVEPPTDPALVAAAEVGADWLLVDVRPKPLFDRGHATGAQAMSLAAVSVSGAVKARPTAIISRGFGDAKLASVVETLREQGATVRVVDGGFAAWCAANRTVTGDCSTAATLSPRTVHGGRSCSAHPVVVVPSTTAEQTWAQTHLPDATLVPLGKPVGPVVQRALGAARVVAVVAPADTAVAPELDGLGAHVFTVEGGLDGYRRFLDGHAAMLARRTVISQGERRVSTGRSTTVRGEKGCGCM